MKGIIGILLCFAFAQACSGEIAVLEADNYAVGESMHQAEPNIKLWRADVQSPNIPYVLEHCYPDIFPIQSTLSDLPLGYNVIANPIGIGEGPYDFWFRDGPYLFIEIRGWLKVFGISTEPDTDTIIKTCVFKGYDENFNQVMNYFDKIGRTFHIDKGDYKVKYIFVLPSSPASLDHIIIDYQPIPDIIYFIESWLSYGCSVDNVWCNGCDINHDTYVDFLDYSRLCQYWYEEY